MATRSSATTLGLKVFSGSANPGLADEVTRLLGVTLGEMETYRFADGEVSVRIAESVRGEDIFVIQPTAPPVNEHLVEMLVILDALRRASAGRVTAVVPYMGYARQDRKSKPREPITMKLVANLLTAAGADRILTVDLHAGQIWGFFDIPLDHLPSRMLLGAHFREMELGDVVVVSPDIGGTGRAREFAAVLQAPIAIIDKRRDLPNQVREITHVIGKVYRRTAILVDDIVDTAGTLEAASNALVARGVEKVYACCTHPILSGPAIERISRSPIQKIVVTNTVPVSVSKRIEKLTIVSIAPMLAEAIRRVHDDRSVSTMFGPPS